MTRVARPSEVSIAWLPFEREALGKATLIRFAGTEIPVATAEDLVIYKALAWRDQDRYDIERLIVLHGKTMDLERIRSFVEQFAEILEDPQRVQEFNRLVQRALGSQ
jgi:predicted nucleotidyltransferase